MWLLLLPARAPQECLACKPAARQVRKRGAAEHVADNNASHEQQHSAAVAAVAVAVFQVGRGDQTAILRTHERGQGTRRRTLDRRIPGNGGEKTGQVGYLVDREIRTGIVLRKMTALLVQGYPDRAAQAGLLTAEDVRLELIADHDAASGLHAEVLARLQEDLAVRLLPREISGHQNTVKVALDVQATYFLPLRGRRAVGDEAD